MSFDQPTDDASGALPPGEKNRRVGDWLLETTPKQIGPNRILEPLGEGGMESAYKAEQRTPFKRIASIKVIKLGFNTKEVIARFESERQAPARMDHPNLCAVFRDKLHRAG